MSEARRLAEAIDLIGLYQSEFHDYHYHGCPAAAADGTSGPCDCYAGWLNRTALKWLHDLPTPPTQTEGETK